MKFPSNQYGCAHIRTRPDRLMIEVASELVERTNFPKLATDVPTLDFSGWSIYTHKDTADHLVVDLCRALEASKDRIPWAHDAPLPLAQWCVTLRKAISKYHCISPRNDSGENVAIYKSLPKNPSLELRHY